MNAVCSNEIEELRNARNELQRLSEFFSLPGSEPLDLIETLLPMANKYSSFQEKADAYHLLRHGQIIGFPEDMDSSELPEANLREIGGSDSGGFRSTEAQLGQTVNKFWFESSADRHEFREVLSRVFESGPAAAQKYLESTHDDIVLIPVLAWVDSQPDLTLKYCPIRIRGVLGHALALLLDRKSDHFSYLRICSLSSCDDYFLSRRTKDKPRKLKYCRDSHISAGSAEKSASRSRTLRERKNVAKKAKHKRKQK